MNHDLVKNCSSVSITRCLRTTLTSVIFTEKSARPRIPISIDMLYTVSLTTVHAITKTIPIILMVQPSIWNIKVAPLWVVSGTDRSQSLSPRLKLALRNKHLYAQVVKKPADTNRTA